jgi:hypothetical protein
LFRYSLAVELPLPDNTKGMQESAAIKNNSLTLNLILCRKKQLNLKRISLLKRKAPHKRKRIPRKKHDKIKDFESPVHRAGLFISSQRLPTKEVTLRMELQDIELSDLASS